MQSEVLMQSKWLVYQAAELYYIQNMSQKEISVRLNISLSTVSRLINKAKEEGLITYKIDPVMKKCIHVSELLCQKYGLKEVIVVPEADSGDANETKHIVAIEGAKYVQRITDNNDFLGIAWGSTMHHLVYYLNPCRKTNVAFITLHGALEDIDENMNVSNLVKRMAMSMGGAQHAFVSPGLYYSPEEADCAKRNEYNQKIIRLQNKVTISISGVGMLYPELVSPLLNDRHLSEADIASIKENDCCADFLLHFLDRNGKNCMPEMDRRALTIDLDSYRKIPQKIVVTSGAKKAYAARAVLKAGYVDVFIADLSLAEKILEED